MENIQIYGLISLLILVGYIGYRKVSIFASRHGGVLLTPLPFILLNYTLIFIYRPFVILNYNVSTLDYEIVDFNDFCVALSLALLSMFSILLPYCFIKRPSAIRNTLITYNFKCNKLLFLNVLLVVLVVSGLWAYGSALNNTANRIDNPEYYNLHFFYIIAQKICLVLGAVTFYAYLNLAADNKQRMLLLLCIITIIPIQFFAAGRGAVFSYVLTCFVIFAFVRFWRMTRLRFAVLCAAAFAILSLNHLFGVFRIVINQPNWSFSDVLDIFMFYPNSDELFSFFANASWDYSVFDVLIRIVNKVDRFEYGGTNLQYMLSLVPRVLWPEKPYDQGFMLYITNQYYSHVYFKNGSTFAGTIVGEGYLNFGIFGVFFYSLLFSLLTINLYQRACFNSTMTSTLLYAIFFPVIQQIVRGGLDVFFNFLIFSAIPLYLIISLVVCPQKNR